MVGGVTSAGVFHRPHLVFRNQLLALGQDPADVLVRSFPLSESTVAELTRGMWGVVNEGGTGASAHEPGLDIAGKTGTAQVVSVQLMKSAHKKEFRNNGWFVGYSPTSGKPEIIVAVLVLGGEHSTVAVPVVREIIKAYRAKKHPQQQQPPTYQTQLQAGLRPDQGESKLPLNCPPKRPQTEVYIAAARPESRAPA